MAASLFGTVLALEETPIFEPTGEPEASRRWIQTSQVPAFVSTSTQATANWFWVASQQTARGASAAATEEKDLAGGATAPETWNAPARVPKLASGLVTTR